MKVNIDNEVSYTGREHIIDRGCDACRSRPVTSTVLVELGRGRRIACHGRMYRDRIVPRLGIALRRVIPIAHGQVMWVSGGSRAWW